MVLTCNTDAGRAGVLLKMTDNAALMVKAFISSEEYEKRFGQ